MCIFAVPVIIGLLIYQRMLHENSREIIQNAQTIIPAAPDVQGENEGSSSEYFAAENVQSVITLSSDEMMLEDLQMDVNGDNKEDKVIAVKKLSDQFIYLVIFLQSTETHLFNRAIEIKTEVTQAKTAAFYTISVPEYAHPIIVVSGMNSDNMQVFGMYATDIDDNETITTIPLVNIQADGKISLQNKGRDAINALSYYTVSAYYSDTDAPNTLNQIERIYTWNERKHIFEQTTELKIPGKKIESQFLKKFQTGNINTFKEFLEGLWYQPAARQNQNRSIFFADNEIIFSINNIQEIFTVDSISPRRYGIYFSTKNTSISSIHRRIDIELTGIDEITVRVIEDVARLKIGASSNWDGMYRKISDTIRDAGKKTAVEDAKKILTDNAKTWTSSEGYTLSFSQAAYTFTRDSIQDSGWYALLQIKDKIILQWKNKEKQERFFTLTFDTQSKNTKLILTEVSVTLNDITLTGTHPLIFE